MNWTWTFLKFDHSLQPGLASAFHIPLRIDAQSEYLSGVSSSFAKSEKIWLRGLDSNQDNQLQRLACYQLHYPGIVKRQHRIMPRRFN